MPRIRWFGHRYVGPLFDVDSPAGSSPAPAPTDPPAPVDPPAAPPAPVDPPADPPADESDPEPEPSLTLDEVKAELDRTRDESARRRLTIKSLKAEIETLKQTQAQPAPVDPAAEATARAEALAHEVARMKAAGSAGVPLTAFEAAQQLLVASDAAGLTAAWQALTAAMPVAQSITPPPITPGSAPKAEGLAGALQAHFSGK